MPSDTVFLGVVRDVTRRFAEFSGLDTATAEGVALAVDECATNVIQHAYEGSPTQRYSVGYSKDAQELRIEVRDHGRRVDTRALPDVDLKRYATEGRKGGLGVHLITRIMDSVAYESDGTCNVCCLVKRRGSRPVDE